MIYITTIMFFAGALLTIKEGKPSFADATQMAIMGFMIITLVDMQTKLRKHHQALRWFTHHIKFAEGLRIEPMPELLSSMVDESDETEE